MSHSIRENSKRYRMVNIILGWVLIVLGISSMALSLLEWIRFGVIPYLAIVGLVLIGLGALILRFQRVDSSFRTMIRGPQAWLEVPLWRDGKIPSQAEYRVQFFFVVSAIFLIFCPTIFFFMQESVLKLINGLVDLKLILEADLLATLLVMNACFLVVATYYILEKKKFSDVYIIIEPFPATPGKDLVCQIELPISYNSKHRFYGDLSCLKYRKLGARHIPHVLWKQKVAGYPTAISESITKVEMAFSVPGEYPESSIKAAMTNTDLSGEGEYYVWKLFVKSKGLRPNLSRTFMLPVFKQK